MLDCRDDFFDFGSTTYLNCAYHGPLPRVAAEALQLAAQMRSNPAAIRNEYHFTFPDAYRLAVAELIGCAPEDVAVTDSTTHGIMLLVDGLDWRPGDEVVIPRAEFPANKLPWLALERLGVVVRQVDLGDGGDAVERIAAAMTERTRVVAAAWVSYLDGRRLDLAPLSALVRGRGALFVVDASQGIGGLPFDLGAIPADLVACSGYKWLLGPYGVGFAYVTPELAARLRPPNVNWFSAEGAFDFNRLADLPFVFRVGAHRFDVNETANFFNLAPAVASLRYLASITPTAVEAHCRELNDRLLAGLPPGFHPLETAARSNIQCVVGPDVATTRAVYERLLAAGIAVSSREGSIRVSPHVYNTAEDIDLLLELLHGADVDAPPPATATTLHTRLTNALALPEEPLDLH